MAAATRPAARWLFNPALDLVLGAGLVYVVVFVALAVAAEPVQAFLPLAVMPLLLLVTQIPHLGATLLRVYDRGETRRRYAIFAVWATLALVILFGAGLYQATVGAILVTLYLTVTPWHFTGQNYGVALVFLGRRGVAIDRHTKRLVYASFILPCALFLVSLHGDRGPVDYVPATTEGTIYPFYALGIPIPDVLLLLGVIAWVWVTGEAVLGLRARAPWRDLGPTLALFGTQALWFLWPVLALFLAPLAGLRPLAPEAQAYTFLWILIAHSIQYLWVTAYYARREQPARSHGRFLLQSWLAGAAVVALPVVLFAPGVLGRVPYDAGLGLLVGSVVSLHHILLDSAIWKLRDGRVASILLAGKRASAAEPDDAPRRGVPVRSFVLAAGALGVLVLGAGGVGEHVFWQQLDRGDLGSAERTAGVLARLGRDSARGRATLGYLKGEAGDYQGARTEFERSLELQPLANTWLNLGLLLQHDGERGDALAAFEASLALEPRDVVALAAAGRMALAEGQWERAERHLAAAAELTPSDDGIQRDLARARGGRRESGMPVPPTGVGEARPAVGGST